MKSLGKASGGFTLVELLIVIAVLAVMAAGLLYFINPGKQQKVARDAVIKSNIAQISLGLESYYTLNRIYPNSLDILATNKDLKTVPVPKGGSQYNYQRSIGCDIISCEAVVYYELNQSLLEGNVWCWRSVDGKAGELPLADCTP